MNDHYYCKQCHVPINPHIEDKYQYAGHRFCTAYCLQEWYTNSRTEEHLPDDQY